MDKERIYEIAKKLGDKGMISATLNLRTERDAEIAEQVFTQEGYYTERVEPASDKVSLGMRVGLRIERRLSS